MSAKKRTAVLISGSGSNLQALLNAARAPDYPAEISLVISNKTDAYGLERAKKAGVKTELLPHANFTTRETYDAALHALLESNDIEVVCLAGFMRILTPSFVKKWRGRMLNIHPSLLPKFTGLHTHKRALEAGEKEHGCTVHFVTDELDAGPVILQARVPILSNDTQETLAARVLEQEHRIYPEALKQICLEKN